MAGSKPSPSLPTWNKAIRAAFTKLAGDNPDASLRRALVCHSGRPARRLLCGPTETFLNVVGIDDILHKMKEVFASLYNDRAISYPVTGASPTTWWPCRPACSAWSARPGRRRRHVHHRHRIGFRDVVFITSSYGLGETVCRAVNPTSSTSTSRPEGRQRPRHPPQPGLKLDQDGVRLAKPAEEKGRHRQAGAPTVDTTVEARNRYSLTNEDVTELAHYAVIIEEHHGRPMDIEWARTAPTASSTSCRHAQKR